MFARGFELGLDAAVRAAASGKGPRAARGSRRAPREATRPQRRRRGPRGVDGPTREGDRDRITATTTRGGRGDEDDEGSESSDDASASSSSASSDASAPSSSPSDPPPPAAPPRPRRRSRRSRRSARPPGALGASSRPPWLARASPAYDEHMGAENLGPALYGLCRSPSRPSRSRSAAGTPPCSSSRPSRTTPRRREGSATGARARRTRRTAEDRRMHPDAPSWYLHETVRERAESIRAGSDDDEETDDDATETATTAGRGGGVEVEVEEEESRRCTASRTICRTRSARRGSFATRRGG